ncbi:MULTISPECIES: amino acid ABC transporter permease [unclassified Variovorax]|uniref:amino acid ABC transporter permease n=1 Tax=unclassified Variovorax TaxID=663243 RepID=UPI0025769829|nr:MULTISPECIES: amino acid ABC transporter permease [unclassified Variovorax]MDM0086635.1 amino acid ABC transporter permease [Variovorax sp. J22G40]MDM0145109.1 amino acid ABC transporter permease [Variovorax sp. J2P1-31]
MTRSFGWPDLLFLIEAARWTVLVSLVAFAGGALGGALICILKLSGGRLGGAVVRVWVQLGQGIPVLMQLFLFYFGLSILGFSVPPLLAAAVAFGLYASANIGVIWLGAVDAIPKQQWEAGETLGLSWAQQMRQVIAPQALRLALAPTVGFMVQIVKNTSLTSVIGIVELARAGQVVNNATYQPFSVFFAICVIYFILCFPLSLLSRGLERRLHVAH